jgi:transcriptional regulator with XRE-family HTH domain
MIERILEILKFKGMSPSQFADEIGVQRSAISHLVSGRNNPSLDFVQRVLKRFPDVSTDWLLSGTGVMIQGGNIQEAPGEPKVISQPEMSLFMEEPVKEEPDIEVRERPKAPDIQPERRIQKKEPIREKRIEKIIFIYNDNTFRELQPE